MLYPVATIDQLLGDFRSYKSRIESKRVILGRPGSDEWLSVPATAQSRYYPAGQRRMVSRIKSRLGRAWNCPGVLITLTYDPARISLAAAWFQVGRHRRALMNKLWQYRRRHGLGRKPLGYLSVLEVQPGTGYPHVHVVVPNVRWVVGNDVLESLWGHGYTDVRLRDNLSPTNYICKYLGKMVGWTDETLALLHNFGVRLYSIGRRYFLPLVKVPSPWFFIAQITSPAQRPLTLACSP